MIRDGVTVPYIKFEFRGDLMQSIHNQYSHLSYQSLANIFETHAWWSTMGKDLRKFIAVCPNCQTHQRQRRTQEREFAQLVTNQSIQPFQRWGIDLIGIL